MTLCAIILAAGKATRMKSQKVKVLHEICGRPMLAYVLDACRAAGVQRLFVVVGHDRERVMQTFAGQEDITWVTQDQQKGTGHAVLVCRSAVEQAFSPAADAFVLAGDGPLIREQTLRTLHATHREAGAALTIATSLLPDPTGYGRVVRDAAQRPERIVEQNDATEEEKKIREVYPSYAIYRVADLFASLDKVQPNNKKGEYYLTETLGILRQSGRPVAAVAAVPPEDILSINTRRELAEVERVMQGRIQGEVMAGGVTLVSPANTWIEFGAQIGEDTVLEPFTWIGQGARIGAGTRVKAGSIVPAGTKIDA